MTDITTVEEVTAEDYTVRVARTDDGQAWEAVVLSEDSGTSVKKRGMAGMLMIPAGRKRPDTDDSDDDTTPIGPPVTAPHRWVAIGFAIEAYEWGEVGEEPVKVSEGYKRVSTDADVTFTNTVGPDTTVSENFPGPWSPGENDE